MPRAAGVRCGEQIARASIHASHLVERFGLLDVLLVGLVATQTVWRRAAGPEGPGAGVSLP